MTEKSTDKVSQQQVSEQVSSEEELLNKALQDGQLIIGQPAEPKGLEITPEEYPELYGGV